MTIILSALTDEELVRFVDRSNPVVDELARRLERILYGPRVTAGAVPEPQLAFAARNTGATRRAGGAHCDTHAAPRHRCHRNVALAAAGGR